MRPTPGEELTGMRRILAEIVAPAVTSEYEAAQLEQVIGSLGRLAGIWDLILPRLQEENDAFSALLDDLALLFEDEPHLALLRMRIRRALRPRDESDFDERPELSFEVINARNLELRGLLDDAITALAASEESAAVAEARRLVRDALRRNLDHALAQPT